MTIDVRSVSHSQTYPRCVDCKFCAIEPDDMYCVHPDVFDRTKQGAELEVMRAPGGKCDGGKLFRMAVKK